MTLLLLTLATSIVAGLLVGGSLSGLWDVRLRGEVALIVLFVIQGIARGRVPIAAESRAWSLAAWVVVTLLVGAICIWNIRQPGMVLVVIGLSLNLLVVLANGGMPVAAGAAGDSASIGSGFYYAASGSEPLYYLGDVLPVQVRPGDLLLLSVGDALLLLGVWVFIFLTVASAERFASRRA